MGGPCQGPSGALVFACRGQAPSRLWDRNKQAQQEQGSITMLQLLRVSGQRLSGAGGEPRSGSGPAGASTRRAMRDAAPRRTGPIQFGGGLMPRASRLAPPVPVRDFGLGLQREYSLVVFLQSTYWVAATAAAAKCLRIMMA